MAINLDPLNELSKEYAREWAQRFIEYLDTKAAVKAGFCCVKCRKPFFDLGPIGIHCDCDYHHPIREPFMYA